MKNYINQLLQSPPWLPLLNKKWSKMTQQERELWNNAEEGMMSDSWGLQLLVSESVNTDLNEQPEPGSKNYYLN